MLTPEQINLFEFNDIVKLYNQLSIDIVADIIERVSQMQEITNTTKYQLEVLKQISGTEVFNQALERTTSLTAETKKALKDLYEDVAKTDIQSYKELYEYKGITYKLSESQYSIINQGLKITNRTLQNLTNSIAFASQQAYINTVDSAYLKAMSGAFSYTKVIEEAVQELTNQGITLKDSAGRNVQLEVAVRRNVLAGIRDTARALDKEISDYLGCDGYEVSAHLGARPTHAEAQGKQYALTAEKAKEYNVGLWSDVEDLWSEYNCRHDYFGIILGISEPVYNNSELKEMKNATVMYNGKEIPYYEATQKQRALENSIRKTKRSIEALKQTGEDYTVQQTRLTKLQNNLDDLLNQTGLAKDYSRLTVGKTSLIKTSKNDIINNKSTRNNAYSITQTQINDICSHELKGIKFQVQPTYNSRIKFNGRTVAITYPWGEVKRIKAIQIGKQDKNTTEFLIDTLLHEKLEAKILITKTDKYNELSNASDEIRHRYINKVITRYFNMKGWNNGNR